MRKLVLVAGFLAVVSAAPSWATPFAYVGSTAGGSPSVKVIDTATDTVVATVPMDVGVGGVAVSPDGSRVYVTPYSIKVIDTATNTVTATIPNLGTTSYPTVSPDGTRLYVLNHTGGGDVIQVIDTATNTQVDTISVASPTAQMVINPAGTRLYVPHGNNGYISVIDTTTKSVIATISGLDWVLYAAITPDGTKLYTGGRPSAPIAVIDTATNSVATNIAIPSGFNGLAVNPAGTRLYALGGTALHVIDIATDTVLTTVTLVDGCGGISGTAIAMNPAGTRAYFHSNGGCDGEAERIFDTASNTIAGAVPVSSPAGYGLYIGPFCPNACSDGNPCTTDSCDQISGCIHTYNTGPCASDGNPCTNDVCDGAGTCTHPNSFAGSSCNDGTFCNGADTCNGAGGCTSHAGDPCPSGPECARTCNEAAGDCLALPGATCTADTNPCTLDQCNGAGACTHPPGNAGGPCASDGNVCTDDICNASGSCTHPNNSAPCNDGNACTINDTCSGGSCSGTPHPEACLDHFQCYKSAVALAPRGQPPYPRFTPQAGVTVVDQFSGPPPDRRQMDLKATKTICNPTDKNGEDATAPNHPQHLESYVVKITTLVPPQPKPTPQVKTIQNQFGTLKLKVTTPDRVMVPSAKVLGTSPPPPLSMPTIDHFKCYAASVAKAPKGQPPYPTWTVQTVTLTDEFVGPLQYDLTKPAHLCNPADKNGEDPTAPTHIAHLVCYTAKLTKLPTPQPKFVKTTVSTNNQFGPEVINATALDELCVPSLKLD